MASTNPGRRRSDELRIVDVITRLIFDPNAVLLPSEQVILQVLAEQLDVPETDRRTLCEQLRSMSASEMIRHVESASQSLHVLTRLSAQARSSRSTPPLRSR